MKNTAIRNPNGSAVLIPIGAAFPETSAGTLWRWKTRGLIETQRIAGRLYCTPEMVAKFKQRLESGAFKGKRGRPLGSKNASRPHIVPAPVEPKEEVVNLDSNAKDRIGLRPEFVFSKDVRALSGLNNGTVKRLIENGTFRYMEDDRGQKLVMWQSVLDYMYRKTEEQERERERIKQVAKDRFLGKSGAVTNHVC